MVGTQVFVSLIICAVLAFALPVAALIVYKLKFRKASLLSALIGAATFILFALVLEQLLHLVMLPVVSGSTAAYVIYGVMAAGIFEETGRFISCRLLMKKRSDNVNAVMMGIGHGGIEAILLIGIGTISYISLAALVNSVGVEGIAEMSGITDEANIALLNAQADSIAAFSFTTVLATILERILAMTLHISASVIVMKAASVKGKLWLYPAAVLLHALFDVPSALYQRQVITSLWVTQLLLAVMAAGAVFAAVKASKINSNEPISA